MIRPSPHRCDERNIWSWDGKCLQTSVLPIVDTRVVARHADGVIVCLLRDVSEIPKVTAAYELLRSFHVNILGAVMIGVPGEVYYTRTIAPVTESVET